MDVFPVFVFRLKQYRGCKVGDVLETPPRSQLQACVSFCHRQRPPVGIAKFSGLFFALFTAKKTGFTPFSSPC
jgi:hypothetical protein